MKVLSFIPFLLARNARSFGSTAAHYKPIGSKQDEYVRDLKDDDISLVVCNGPAGTGKTLFACQAALDSFGNGMCKNVVITRPTVSTERDLGALPGDIDSKLSPWIRPIVDSMSEFKSKSIVKNLMESGRLEIAPIGFMRGRTFKRSFIIADEMQNSTPDQMKMLLTRVGTESTLVVTGDTQQCDHRGANGLEDLVSRLGRYFDSTEDMRDEGISVIQLDTTDIQRSDLVKTIMEVYSE